MSKLTETEQKKVLTHLREKWGPHKRCNICKKNSWEVVPNIFELKELPSLPGVVITPGEIIPVIAIVCINCGNTVLLNALKIGLKAYNPERSKKAKKTKQ